MLLFIIKPKITVCWQAIYQIKFFAFIIIQNIANCICFISLIAAANRDKIGTSTKAGFVSQEGEQFFQVHSTVYFE
ncbi:Uncharacterised protein [Fluoribacter dumoffii]|uniref:Uncharacterized protein n=1 Tax=Fluoribacter dumoffii TaxID=463 RepID=A0A377G7Z0_9GAMM|nr:hypothetical protein Ldum_0570 [Fluoribacter dumoffii NY 23]STO20611.1 Uncharacterised protein [Fluoribacter dumoffii]